MKFIYISILFTSLLFSNNFNVSYGDSFLDKNKCGLGFDISLNKEFEITKGCFEKKLNLINLECKVINKHSIICLNIFSKKNYLISSEFIEINNKLFFSSDLLNIKEVRYEVK